MTQLVGSSISVLIRYITPPSLPPHTINIYTTGVLFFDTFLRKLQHFFIKFKIYRFAQSVLRRQRETPLSFCLRAVVNEFHSNLEKTTSSILSVILFNLWFLCIYQTYLRRNGFMFFLFDLFNGERVHRFLCGTPHDPSWES